MYDTLLDHDLEDEVVVVDGDVEIEAKGLDDDIDDDDGLSLDLPDDDAKDDAAAALDFDDEAPDGESWSDDPVRMYLTQMGEIPLLTRQQEITLAKQIEITRAPRSAAGCWSATTSFSAAVKVLKRVHAASCRSTARCRSR